MVGGRRVCKRRCGGRLRLVSSALAQLHDGTKEMNNNDLRLGSDRKFDH